MAPQRRGRLARLRILDIIRENPGISKSALCARLGCGWSTVNHHLSVLECERKIDVERGGHECWIFPQGHENNRVQAIVLRQEGVGQVMEALEAGRATVRAIASFTGMTAKMIRTRLSALVGSGLVQRVPGRTVGYSLVAPGRAPRMARNWQRPVVRSLETLEGNLAGATSIATRAGLPLEAPVLEVIEVEFR